MTRHVTCILLLLNTLNKKVSRSQWFTRRAMTEVVTPYIHQNNHNSLWLTREQWHRWSPHISTRTTTTTTATAGDSPGGQWQRWSPHISTQVPGPQGLGSQELGEEQPVSTLVSTGPFRIAMALLPTRMSCKRITHVTVYLSHKPMMMMGMTWAEVMLDSYIWWQCAAEAICSMQN